MGKYTQYDKRSSHLLVRSLLHNKTHRVKIAGDELWRPRGQRMCWLTPTTVACVSADGPDDFLTLVIAEIDLDTPRIAWHRKHTWDWTDPDITTMGIARVGEEVWFGKQRITFYSK